MKSTSSVIFLFRQNIFLITVLFILLCIAVISRFYQLGQVPHGITWDEAAIGYNGYSVTTTRRDEWLQKLPISFQSYGDYKAPLAIYIAGVSTFFLGITPFAVRLPFAVAGILFIFSFGIFVKNIFENLKLQMYMFMLGIVFAITSPWHFHYSRIGFESGMAVSFITFSLAALTYVGNQYKNKIFNKTSIFLLFLSGLGFVASLYTYHSAKITVPLLLVFLVILYRKLILDKKIVVTFVILVCGAALYPLLKDSLLGSGAERANVLLTSQGLPIATLISQVCLNFFKHFTVDFLLLGKVDSLRHGTGSWGVLTPVTAILALAGFLSIFSVKNPEYVVNKKIWMWALALLITGIIPAAFSAETVPHSNRSLLSLPGFLVLSLLGVHHFLYLFRSIKKDIIQRIVIGTVVLLEFLFFINLFQYYFGVFARKSTADFQDGYIEALTIAKQYETGDDKPEVSKIIFSSEYGQPYMYALFVRKTSPIYYRGGSLNKYSFTDRIFESELTEKNILVVTTPSMNFPIDRATYIVKGADESPRFLLYYTGN